MIVSTYCNNCDANIGTMDTLTDYRAAKDSPCRPADAKPEDLVFHLTNLNICDDCGTVPVTIRITDIPEQPSAPCNCPRCTALRLEHHLLIKAQNEAKGSE